MSSTAALPGSPGGLPCPACGPISPFAQRGDILWYCREKCGLYHENYGPCWGVNHPAHCSEIVELIMAMIFLKKEGSPETRVDLNMGTIASEGKKPIAQPKDQKSARNDTSAAVSQDHKKYLDECAAIFQRPTKEVLAVIIQRQINEDAAKARVPELKIMASKYAKGVA